MVFDFHFFKNVKNKIHSPTFYPLVKKMKPLIKHRYFNLKKFYIFKKI